MDPNRSLNQTKKNTTMAALNFPSNPAVNDIFTSGDRSWKYNGVAWQLQPKTTDNIAEGTTNLYFTNARVASAPAVTALQSDLASEVSTRESEISRLDTRVDNVLENLDPVKIDSFTEVLSKLTADKGELADAIVALGTSAESALGTERDARIAADNSLRSDLNSEISRATTAEAGLAADIASETSARQQAITTEQSARAAAITAEQNARAAAIAVETSAREAAITAEQNARAAAITAEQNARTAAIAVETSAREAAINTVTNSLNSEISRAQAAESDLSDDISALETALDNEVDRAETAEAGLAADIAAETSARELAISTEQTARATAVSAEETRATGVEAQLRSDLTSEIANRETAVSAEATARENAISAERSARESAVSSLNTRVDNVLSNVDPAALDSLTEVVSAFQSADSSINGAITSLAASASSDLASERDARIAADDAINTTVSTLTDSIPGRVRDAVLTGISFATSAAISAGDSVLAAFGKLQAQVNAAFSAIDTEVSDRQSEVSRLDGRVDTEISDRQSDVQSVRDSLGTIAGQNANNVNITGGTISGVTLNAQSMEVGQGQTADLFVGNDGKVGIGTEAPSEKLTVNGNIDMLNNRIKNLADGVDSTDAVNKSQLDTAVSGVQSALDTEISDRAAAVQNLEDTKQIKLVVSDTAPAHIDGREWLDTTDFRRYISITGSWVESITA